MTVTGRIRGAASSAGSLARRGTERGAHEARVRKLQWEISRHKAAIGKAIYPLLETGAVEVDIPEVNEQLARIRERHEQLRQLEVRRHQHSNGASDAPDATIATDDPGSDAGAGTGPTP